MNLSEINWNIEYAGSWPTPVKGLIIALLCGMVVGGWYYLDTGSQLEALSQVTAKEGELREQFELQQKKAGNLEGYKQQLMDIGKSFGDLLRQLPNKTEVPELLTDVSQTGLASGLEFDLFKPSAEIAREFYAELPIEIRVRGHFAEFGQFVSGLAALPRIVTIHNIKITVLGAKDDKFPLSMSALARTYRYLDDGASAEASSPAPAKPK